MQVKRPVPMHSTLSCRHALICAAAALTINECRTSSSLCCSCWLALSFWVCSLRMDVSNMDTAAACVMAFNFPSNTTYRSAPLLSLPAVHSTGSGMPTSHQCTQVLPRVAQVLLYSSPARQHTQP